MTKNRKLAALKLNCNFFFFDKNEHKMVFEIMIHLQAQKIDDLSNSCSKWTENLICFFIKVTSQDKI